MIYSNLYTNREKKIPSLLAFFILILSILIFSNIFFGKTANFSKASVNYLKNWQIVNVSPYQVSVYWSTQEKSISYLLYGENNSFMVPVYDDRDTKDIQEKRIHHYVTLKNLKPNQKYYFSFVVDNKRINNQSFYFKTPLTFLSQSRNNPIAGVLLKENLTPQSQAIVILNTQDDVFPIATLTKETGEWLLAINSFYDKNYLEKKIDENQVVNISIITEDKKLTTIKGRIKELNKSDITSIVGKNYDMTYNGKVLGVQDNKLTNQKKNIDLFYPVEGSLIPGKRPIIKGKALPFKKVSIEISAKKTVVSEVKADEDGNWSYFLTEDLDLGNNQIIIKTIDENGKKISIKRNFMIVTSGGFEGKVLGTATDESSLNITKTIEVSPTEIIYPTNTPLPTKLLNSGSWQSFPIFFGSALLILGLGIILVF